MPIIVLIIYKLDDRIAYWYPISISPFSISSIGEIISFINSKGVVMSTWIDKGLIKGNLKNFLDIHTGQKIKMNAISIFKVYSKNIFSKSIIYGFTNFDTQ